MYHPDVTAPGVNISSTCDSLGTVVGPCPPGENTEASGTSMASPHVAGAAAVLLQANPKLTPTQVFTALQSTATKVTKTGSSAPAPFWEAGYGYVNLSAAVDLVRTSDYASRLTSMRRSSEAAVIAGNPWKPTRSDFWTWDAPHVTVAGIPDTKTFNVSVSSATKGVKVALAYPSGGTVGINGMSYVATVTDAAGRVLGTTTANDFNGSSSLLLDLSQLSGVTYGQWTITVTGDHAVSDPDTIDSDSDLGRMVTTEVALLTH
jgi:serine protease AprX